MNKYLLAVLGLMIGSMLALVCAPKLFLFKHRYGRRRKRYMLLRVLLGVLCLVSTGNALAQSTATVTTDKSDYSPGSTVNITGAGFQPGETVQCQVLRIDIDENSGPEHQPWTATADTNGNFQTTWYVTADEVGATLRLTAAGLTSGRTAQSTFTDGSSSSMSGKVLLNSGTGSGVAGATIKAYTDAALTTLDTTSGSSTTSAANGSWTVNFAKDTTRYVVITPPTGYYSSSAVAGSGPTPTVVSSGEFSITTSSSGQDSTTGSQFIVTDTATATQSTVSASPTSVTADGSTTSTITVTLKDANSNPVSGKTVTLAKTSGSGSPTITTTQGTTDSSGHATFTVKSTTAAADVFTATDTTDTVVVTQTATVTFTAGTPTAAQSTVSASPTSVTADGSTTSTITVTLKDANSNPVSGKTVTLAKTSGSGSPTITTTQGTTDSSGHATFTVKSTTAAADVFTATDTTDTVVVTQTATVTFTAGTPTAAQSTVSASPTSITADGSTTSTITVTLEDANSNPVSGKTVTLAKTSGSGSPTTTTTQGTTDSSGHATFTVKSTTAAADVFTATDTTDTVVVTQTATVTFTPGPLDHFAISTISSPQTAGTAITGITLTAQDANNNTVTGFSGAGNTVTYSGTAGVTGTSGNFSSGVLSAVSVTPVTAGAGKTLIVTGGSPGKTGTATFDVNPGAIASYVVTASTPQTAGGTFSATVTAKDANNNTVTTDSSTVVTMTGSGSVQFDSNGDGTFGDNTKTLSSGALSINAKDNVAETITITATSSGGKTGTSSGITVGKAVPSISGVTTSPTITYGTTSVTLSGTVSAAGGVYPANGERGTISATINGHAVTGAFNNSAGSFSINYNDASLATVAAGSYQITYAYAGDANLNAAANNTGTSLAVNQAGLTITANAQSKTYGQTMTFGSGSSQFTSSGLQNSETIDTVTITDTDSGGVSTAAAGGTYHLTPSAAHFSAGASGNYTIAYDPGLLTVNKATPALAAPAASSITYGQTLASSVLTGGSASNPYTSASVDGSFAFTTPTNAPDAGTASQSVTFAPTDTTDYNSATTTTSVTVNQAATVSTVASSSNPALPGTLVTFTNTLTVVSPGAGVPTGTVTFMDGTNVLGTGAINGSGAATYGTNNLSHANHTITAEYAGDGNFIGSTNTLSPNEVINTPPYAAPVFLATTTGGSLTVAESDIIGFGYDADGDSLTIPSVDSTSAHGGTITVSDGSITYHAPGTFAGNDTFSYVIQDTFNAKATNTVSVAVSLGKFSSAINSTSADSNYTHLIGYGIPGRPYNIQRSDDNMATWQTIGTANARSDGLILFDDSVTTGNRFYRFQMP